MFEILNQLEELQLDYLSDEWLQDIFDSDFVTYEDLPPDFERIVDNIDLHSVFLQIIQSIDDWLNNEDSPSEEKSWATLSHEVQHQKLLGLIAYCIDFGNKNVSIKKFRDSALSASLLYYKLLSIPGYKAYHIYHSQLFVNSLVCLSFPKILHENGRSNVSEIQTLLREMQTYVADLTTVIKILQLKATDLNYEDILSSLVEIIGGAFVNNPNIYKAIDNLICNNNAIPHPDAIKLLFKCLLSKFVAASANNQSSKHAVKMSYVRYTALLLKTYRKLALPGYFLLLQHLCYKLDGLERAEVRNSRISLVILLMNFLPTKSYKEITKWLLKLSNTRDTFHRQIAVDILYKLLANDPEEQRNEGKRSEIQSENQNQSVVSSAVVADDNEVEICDANVAEQNANDISDDVIVCEASSSARAQTQSDSGEGEEMGTERKHTAPHKNIICAIITRVHDVKSAIRWRALSMLTECVDSTHAPTQNAMKELYRSSEGTKLLALAMECVNDERSLVRRSGVNLLHRILSNMRHETSAYVAILVRVCRDTSITVRTAAINSISELVIQQHSDDLLDAFLAGPMHQLSDPEKKIQELVLSQIRQMLFDRLDQYRKSEQGDVLPWLFLAAIIRNDMHKHLQKACTLISESSNCINQRLMNNLKTHLGSVDEMRDLQCLILLTSIARIIECPDLNFLLNYYYKFKYMEKQDVRVLALVLEMLTLWSNQLEATDREKLRTDLINRISSPSNAVNDGCRMACATLAAHLEPHSLQWATELMNEAERRAIRGGELEEFLRAADLSLVAPVPPSRSLLEKLLAQINITPGADGKTLGMCVAAAGRLCVRSRKAAEIAAPHFARLLRESDVPLQPKLNALHALTDICVNYTSIVELWVDDMCKCLNVDATPLLRHAASQALTRLLLGGYLRLRTSLYYRYCALVADEDEEVRELAEYYVNSCLPVETICNNFVSCLFHYNKEDESISSEARQLVYDVMLQRMSLTQKLQVQCRLATNVLQEAANHADENDGELNPPMYGALADTITILRGPRMRLSKKPQNTGDAADVEESQERATPCVVSNRLKRTVAEKVVPAALRLFLVLRNRGGDLLTQLGRIINDLLVDYRLEVEELVVNDDELTEHLKQYHATVGTESPIRNNLNNRPSTSNNHETPRSVRRTHTRTHTHTHDTNNTNRKRSFNS